MIATSDVKEKYLSKTLNELLSKDVKELLVEVIIRLEEVDSDLYKKK
jgi:hypothetical protein